MNTSRHRTPTLIVTGLMVLAPAMTLAETEEVTMLSKPESMVSFGAGYLSNDNARFGQYTGLRQDGGYGLADVSWITRNDATGTWMSFDGRNVGFSDREFRFEHSHQGDWGYFLEFSQTPRYNPYTVNTELSGIGSATQTVDGEPFRDVQLKTERRTTTFGFNKWLAKDMTFQMRLRDEEKTGSRLFGRTGFDFLAEPIDSRTQALEATLGYAGNQWQLSGGYTGSWYNNENTALYGIGGSGAAYSPIGLPPDSEAHRLHLAGGYNFTPETRGTFQIAYNRALQHDEFIVPSLPGNSSLDGRVDTTQMQVGVSSRPMNKLSLLANFRYEDRDDKTPIRLYSSLAGATSTFNGLYEPRSIKTKFGTIEAGYQLPNRYRATFGIDHEIKERNVPYWLGGSLASVTAREETDETTYRLKLRRTMSETVNGAVSYAHSKRDGSDYPTTVLNDGTTGSNLVAPLHLADRDRDRWRLMVDWTATEKLSLQLAAEDVRDDYSGRTYGPRSGTNQNYSLDASYALSDAWQLTAWLSRNETDSEQTTQTSAPQPWSAKLGNLGDAIGLGGLGQLSKRLRVGVDLQYTSDHGEYDVSSDTPIPGAITLPPDTHYRVTRFKLFVDRALQKNAGIRVDYAFERWKIDDWAWETWTYTDGTRIFQDLTPSSHFIGVSGYYHWW